MNLALARAHALVTEAEHCYDVADFERANLLYGQAFACGPEDAEILNIVAVSVARRGDTANALTLLTLAIDKRPDNPVLRSNLALVREARGAVVLNAAIPEVSTLARRANPQHFYLLLAPSGAEDTAMSDATLARVLDLFGAGEGRMLWLGGGDVTGLDDWPSLLAGVARRGFRLGLIDSLARALNEAEIAALSRVAALVVRLDAAADATTHVVSNLIRLRAAAAFENRPAPALSISCVAQAATLAGLPALVALAHACGIDALALSDGPQDLAALLAVDETLHATVLEIMTRMLETGQRLGVKVDIEQGLLAALGGVPAAGPQAGSTRECLDPWNLLLFKPDGSIHTCSAGHPAVAHVEDVATLGEIFFSAANLQCKQALLDGCLPPACRHCARKTSVPLVRLADAVAGLCP